MRTCRNMYVILPIHHIIRLGHVRWVIGTIHRPLLIHSYGKDLPLFIMGMIIISQNLCWRGAIWSINEGSLPLTLYSDTIFHEAQNTLFHLQEDNSYDYAIRGLRFVSSLSYRHFGSDVMWRQRLFCVCVASLSLSYPCTRESTRTILVERKGRRHGKSVAFTWRDVITKELVKHKFRLSVIFDYTLDTPSLEINWNLFFFNCQPVVMDFLFNFSFLHQRV